MTGKGPKLLKGRLHFQGNPPENKKAVGFDLSPTAFGWIGAFTMIIFLDLVWFREQFCNYICPYARFQGVLAGPESLIVSYDEPRGEPRGKGGRKKREALSLGSCVSCSKCVAVCPTGIDIRDGYQLECIGCAKCIDACTTVMSKFKEPSLVRYSSVVEDRGETRKVFGKRAMIYSGLLLLIGISFAVMLAGRHTLDATVNRAPGTLFTIDTDGAVRNTYMLHVENKLQVSEPIEVTVAVEGLPGAELIVPGISLGTGKFATVPLIIRVPDAGSIPRTSSVDIILTTELDEITLSATFKSGTVASQ